MCANAAIRNSWHAVAASADVDRSPIAVTLLGTKVVLYRAANGEVVVAADRCPHREAPLSLGVVESGCLTCPYHGWTFGDGGHCVRIPSSPPGVPAPPRAHLATFHVSEKFGLVWICLGQPRGPLFDIAEESDPTFRRINTPVEMWKTSATRMTDNFCDITHFPYVHLATFGGAQDPLVPKVELAPLDDHFYGYRYEILAGNSGDAALSSGQSTSVVERAMTTGFNLPFTVRSTIRYASGLAHIILLLSTPVDDETSLFTFVIWRNDDFSVPAAEVIRFDLAIGAEDKRMLELLDGVLPLDQTSLVNVQADKCSVEWRRRLVEMMSSVP
ncbi:MAG: aromatic ring-hydroxylating dioxygenase subunit alpha [Ilumatobacteraceae bacterium]